MPQKPGHSLLLGGWIVVLASPRQRVRFHPCDNTASVVVSHDMFMKFLNIWGGEIEWIEI